MSGRVEGPVKNVIDRHIVPTVRPMRNEVGPVSPFSLLPHVLETKGVDGSQDGVGQIHVEISAQDLQHIALSTQGRASLHVSF